MPTRTRIVRLLTTWISTVLLSLTVASAETVMVDAPPSQAVSSLEITDKTYDEPSGTLSLRLTNESPHQTVTAFGVAVVRADSEGFGSTQIKTWELLPGGGLAPGESQEAIFDIGYGTKAGVSPSALGARIHYEIFDDMSSRGNGYYIDKVFEARKLYLDQIETTLERLRGVHGSISPKRALDGFWAEEADRRARAERALVEQAKARSDMDSSETERARWSAIVKTTDLSEQTRARIEAGEPAGVALERLERALRDHLLEPISRGVRTTSREFAAATVPSVKAAGVEGCRGGRESSDPDIKAFTTNCFLHPGGGSNSYGHNCPVSNPWLTVQAHYYCEECQTNGPWRTASATGYGECYLSDGSWCTPELLYVNYQAVWLEIAIQNRTVAFPLCVDNATAGTTHFSRLRLWVDADHDGVSAAGELFRLHERGVESVDLGYRELNRRDKYGNTFRYASEVQLTDRTGRAWDVFFRQAATN